MRVKRKERNIARKIVKRAYGTELKRVPIAREKEIIAECRRNCCHLNVLRQVIKNGGRLVMGQVLNPVEGAPNGFEAWGHYVWETPDGELKCVSPIHYPLAQELIDFIPIRTLTLEEVFSQGLHLPNDWGYTEKQFLFIWKTNADDLKRRTYFPEWETALVSGMDTLIRRIKAKTTFESLSAGEVNKKIGEWIDWTTPTAA